MSIVNCQLSIEKSARRREPRAFQLTVRVTTRMGQLVIVNCHLSIVNWKNCHLSIVNWKNCHLSIARIVNCYLLIVNCKGLWVYKNKEGRQKTLPPLTAMRKITIKNDSAVALLPSHRRGPGSLNEKLLSTAKVRTPFEIASVLAEKNASQPQFFLLLGVRMPFVTDKCYFSNPSSINTKLMSKVILPLPRIAHRHNIFALSKARENLHGQNTEFPVVLHRHPRDTASRPLAPEGLGSHHIWRRAVYA